MSLEYERGRPNDELFKPYFSPIFNGALSRFQHMVAHIAFNVPLGGPLLWRLGSQASHRAGRHVNGCGLCQ